jgi:Laminin G domain.
LEFNTKLKVKKRGEFIIDFRTTQKDGVIFYVADETNRDFIALFMKGGKVRLDQFFATIFGIKLPFDFLERQSIGVISDNVKYSQR